MEKFKELIKSDGKQGDKQLACSHAGVTRSVLDTALKKQDLSQCTNGELRVLNELRTIIEERKKILSAIQL